MPLYLFQHIDTQEVREVVYHMNEEKDYRGENGKEKGKWKRLYIAPAAAFDSLPLDPYSAKDFSRVTNKGGKLSDLFDRSAELSEKRAAKDGIDHHKQKHYANYSKRHGGKQHPQQKQEHLTKVMKESGFNIEYGD